MSRILLDPAARIGFTPTPDDPLGAVQALMARFSDGEDHERRRRIAVDLLDSPLRASDAPLRDDPRLDRLVERDAWVRKQLKALPDDAARDAAAARVSGNSEIRAPIL